MVTIEINLTSQELVIFVLVVLGIILVFTQITSLLLNQNANTTETSLGAELPVG